MDPYDEDRWDCSFDFGDEHEERMEHDSTYVADRYMDLEDYE